jgi:hypothetical protein
MKKIQNHGSKAKLLARTVLGTAALSITASVALSSQAKAEQLWDPYLRGVHEGEAAGALPPPGWYGVLNNYYADYSQFDSKGNKIEGSHLSALVELPILLYVPGIKILGADYGVAMAQAFDYTSFAPSQAATPGGGNLGTYNTVLLPAILSWKLPYHFSVRTSLTLLLPDGSSSPSSNLKNGGLGSANDFMTVQPDLGVSWLYNGWNVSVSTHYAVPVTDSNAGGINYHTAAEFSADYTVTKTIGAWTMGVGGEQENQFSNDSVNGVSKPGTRTTNYGVGPIVGYQFKNGLSLMALWNHTMAHSDVAGDFFDLRLTTAF